NDYLQLINNNFSDHITFSGKSGAIWITDYNDRVTIKGNSFYQTTAINISTHVEPQYYEIHLETIAGGGNHLIDSNYFGGSGPRLSGGKLSIRSAMHVSIIYARGIEGQP